MIFLEIDYIDNNMRIIDIRDNSSFNNSHLDNSINVSLHNIVVNHSKFLDKNKEYLIICEYGIQSKIIVKMLNNLGYHVYSLKDGYSSLIRKGKVKKLT